MLLSNNCSSKGVSVGGSSRYDRTRPVGDREARQARALHTLAELLAARPTRLTALSDAVRGQIGQVFHTAANELGDGRAMPIAVRRAVIGLADAVRLDLDPRPRGVGRGPGGASDSASPAD